LALIIFSALSIEKYLHRNPLNYFSEVAGCIVRRQQGKNRAGPALKAVHFPREFLTTNSVDRNFSGLTGPNPAKLRLFKIGNNPNVWFDDGHNALAKLHSLAGFQGLIGDVP
jgi:hypothetical protein